MKKQKKPQSEVVRYTKDEGVGLSADEVASRRLAGLNNDIPKSNAKPYFKIFVDNICTFFNLIWALLFVVVLTLFLMGEASFGNLFFIVVIIANTVLAIVQEIRAKRTVERLSLITAPKVEAVRDGEHVFISAEELVLDDVVVFSAGSQIPADAVLLSGKVEMNESLLTGESVGVKKAAGDVLYAGSFVISGGCRARIEKVGADSYIQTIAKAAKAFKSPKSDLFRDINRIIKWIGVAIVPFSAFMLWNNYQAIGRVVDGVEYTVYHAILDTAGSIQGMIPAGMFLLITVALSLGVVKLAFKKTLVKDVYSVEMLSRTNRLCLDKTGTITDGTMRVSGERTLAEGHDVANAIANVFAAQDSTNFTADAVRKHYAVSHAWSVVYNIPFSSKRKYTATAFEGVGTYAVGAPEFLNAGVLPDALIAEIDAEAREGRRVLLLAYSEELLTEDALPKMTPVGLVMLEDHIREEAYDTIRWFRENGVGVKIISGDNPLTVAAIARRVGVENAELCISLEGKNDDEVWEIADRYTVFGRVSPEQKHILVKSLKKQGFVVAMTGDGVNDTLALKEADCSIAMADGSEVARDISNIVLLNNSFASLPSVVCEGRQVINNVQRSSTLFLMKTLCAIFLSVGCILFSLPAHFAGAFEDVVTYPFNPENLMLLEALVTGVPSVILALEPNDRLIEGSFVREVLRRCVPNGLLMLLNSVAVMVMHYALGMFTGVGEFSSVLTIAFTVAGLINLYTLCIPMNKLRIATVAFSTTAVAVCVFLLGGMFGIVALTAPVLFSAAILAAVSVPLHIALSVGWRALLSLFSRKAKAKR